MYIEKRKGHSALKGERFNGQTCNQELQGTTQNG